MALTLPDCRVGTIVDHTHEWTEDGRELHRPIVRRGIIWRVVGDNSSNAGVKEVWVKFKKDQEPEKIKGAELSRVFHADTRVAIEALRRLKGEPKHVGAEFAAKKVFRQRVEDGLALTPKRSKGVVTPPIEEAVDDIIGVEEEES